MTSAIEDALSDAVIAHLKPITLQQGRGLRDLPISIANGEATARRIVDAALDTTVTTAGTDWVLNRNAGLSVNAVGAYQVAINTTASNINAGDVVAGSSLRYPSGGGGGIGNAFDIRSLAGTTVLSGTWRAIVGVQATDLTNYYPGLFVRIT